MDFSQRKNLYSFIFKKLLDNILEISRGYPEFFSLDILSKFYKISDNYLFLKMDSMIQVLIQRVIN